MKVYLATSDNTSWALTIFQHLADKYLPNAEFIVLGYNEFPTLPSTYKCISLSPKQESLNVWSYNLYLILKEETDEYVMFGLEDFFPTRPLYTDVFNSCLEFMKTHNSVRYEMGEGHPWHPSKKQVAFFPDYHIYEYNQTSLYRISTQFSVWNTEYLLYHLKQRFSPWDFELEGSRIAMNDGKQIIASSPKYALHWVHSGLSGKYPDKVNVVGIKREDVEEMISKGLLQRDKLQLGIEHNSPLYK